MTAIVQPSVRKNASALADSRPQILNLCRIRTDDLEETGKKVFEVKIMAKFCPITKKKPISGNRVSHANNKTRRRFEPNLHEKRFWVPSENRFVRLKVSANGMKTIDKVGIDKVLSEMRQRGEKV